MIYGTTAPHLVRDQTDLIGIRVLIMRQYWQATTEDPSQADLDALKPVAPRVPGGLIVMGEQTLKERGRFATYWTYQGINGDGKSVTFKDRNNSLDYGFEPGFSQVPIQVDKNFSAMLDKFQGYPSNDGTTVIWPPQLAAQDGANGLTVGQNTGSGKLNPMFGIQSYFEMDGVYRHRYAERSLPPNLFEGVGYIATDLPGNPQKLDDGRNWLKAPPVWTRKGVVYDITEYYWASRRGGWPEPVYRRGYFNS